MSIDINKRTKGDYLRDRNHVVKKDAQGVIIASCNLLVDDAEANAAFIVTACNNFDDLVSIAKTVKFWFGNEANYPKDTAGYNLAQKCKELLNQLQ